jgi:hypothetical protein
VRGNQSGIYHDLESHYYDVTLPEECFATAEVAEAAGCGRRSDKRLESKPGGYYTNQYTNPPETPLNIGEHYIRENGLPKPFR